MTRKPLLFAAPAALAFAFAASAADVTWTGSDATDPTDWFAPDNWDGAAVPAAGDSVTIGSGASVVLSAPTPALASVSVAGTLTFTNWTTCLSATTVTIPSGGTVTCAGPFKDTDETNRVWIACTDLTVASGGKIDVSGKGFAAISGPGKGFTNNQIAGGGAHGGYGSTINHTEAVKSSLANSAYDSASEPILPGSGGGGHPGGGAIRIDASGVVTLNGNLLANGQDAGNSDNKTGGAGGAILVNCDRIVAAAGVKIYAEGGNLAGRNYPKTNIRVAGAGGRIAIHYDTSLQMAADMAGAFVSAAAGYDTYLYNTTTRRYPASRYYLVYCNAAQDGTLWFPDTKVFGTDLACLGTHFAGRLVNVSSLSVDGNLTVTNRLGFANEGVSLTVTGNLSVDGNFGKLVFGETEETSTRARKRAAGSSPVSLTVGGNFSLSNGARADIHAGATNGTGVAGATISVGGAFNVASNSTVYLYSHPSNGGAPIVTAASCSIAEGALVSADTFGFESSPTVKNAGAGPGSGISNSTGEGTGASHGGLGGNAAAAKIYDSAIYPTLPGSSGGAGQTEARNSPQTLAGGGAIHIKTTGAFVLNGTITANGILQANRDDAKPYQYKFGGGSGGSILLEGRTFSGGATAVLSANGGSFAASTSARGGGGGRISIIVGDEYSPDLKPSCLEIAESLPASFLGTATVSGGEVGGDGTYSAPGADGTIRYVTVGLVKPTIVSFR